MKAEHDDDDLSVVSTGSYWNSAVQTSVRYARPATPKLVPIVICLCTIPVLVVLSVAAGWLVYSGVAVGWKTPLHLQYGDGRPPYAHTQLPNLSPSTPYDLSLVINVPTNYYNVALGNFMATLHLVNAKNTTIAHVRRAAIVLEPSPIFILFGRPRRLTEITVPLLASFTPSTTSINAIVEIGRQDNWKAVGSGEGRELSVYSAYISGEVRPRGLRYILSKFPISSAVVASTTFFFLSAFALLACLIPVMFRSVSDGSEPPPQEPTAPEPRDIGRRSTRLKRDEDNEPGVKEEPDSDSSAVDLSATKPGSSSSTRFRVKRESSPPY